MLTGAARREAAGKLPPPGAVLQALFCHENAARKPGGEGANKVSLAVTAVCTEKPTFGMDSLDYVREAAGREDATKPVSSMFLRLHGSRHLDSRHITSHIWLVHGLTAGVPSPRLDGY